MKKIIYIFLYIILSLEIFNVFFYLWNNNLSYAFSGFFGAVISAYFIERIKKEKIGKLGWVMAGILTLIFAIIFLLGLLLPFLGNSQ